MLVPPLVTGKPVGRGKACSAWRHPKYAGGPGLALPITQEVSSGQGWRYQNQAVGRHSWKHLRGGTIQVVCPYFSFPSPMSNTTGKLSNISPTDSAWLAESISLVITFFQAAEADKPRR